MDIIITNASGQPIYEQIVGQIKALIINGTLKEGDMLPSMRLLAKELQGFIVSQTGKGSFVAPQNVELIREAELQHIEQLLSQAVDKARASSVSLEELQEMLAVLYGAL